MTDVDPRDPPAESEDELPEERAAGGMLDAKSWEAQAAAEAVKKQAAEQARGDDAPAVDDDKLKELKAQARKKIEEGIIAKRKQRRLLRGGDVSR